MRWLPIDLSYSCSCFGGCVNAVSQGGQGCQLAGLTSFPPSLCKEKLKLFLTQFNECQDHGCFWAYVPGNWWEHKTPSCLILEEKLWRKRQGFNFQVLFSPLPFCWGWQQRWLYFFVFCFGDIETCLARKEQTQPLLSYVPRGSTQMLSALGHHWPALHLILEGTGLFHSLFVFDPFSLPAAWLFFLPWVAPPSIASSRAVRVVSSMALWLIKSA